MSTAATYITVSTSEMYDSIADLVKKLVWKFVKKYGGDFDEWVSDANLSAVKAINAYDNTNGAKLSTWVYNYVYFDLVTTVQNRIQRSKRNEVSLAFEATKADAVARLSTLLVDISDDAKTLISCFIESDTTQRANTVRRTVREQLKKAGWNTHRFTDVLEEVRTVLVETL